MYTALDFYDFTDRKLMSFYIIAEMILWKLRNTDLINFIIPSLYSTAKKVPFNINLLGTSTGPELEWSYDLRYQTYSFFSLAGSGCHSTPICVGHVQCKTWACEHCSRADNARKTNNSTVYCVGNTLQRFSALCSDDQTDKIFPDDHTRWLAIRTGANNKLSLIWPGWYLFGWEHTSQCK